MNKYDLTITKLHQMVKEGIVPGVSYLIFDHQHTIKEVTGMAQVYPETEILNPGMLYDVQFRLLPSLFRKEHCL